jgi:protein-S-isoprenylcysteine O-methyltransferase Ste14
MTIDRIWDWLARAIFGLVFAVLAIRTGTGAYDAAAGWSNQSLDHTLLDIGARVSNAMFLAMVAATAVIRLRPLRKAPGLEPRVSALLGTFLAASLALLPSAQQPPIWLAISSALVIVGASLSLVVVRQLGKSFSLMAEARQLVTNGAYGVVRHPLYVCEEITILGIVIQVLSPAAIVIAIAHGLLQLRRIFNEERILRAAFPAYDHYSSRTPRLVPRGFRLRIVSPTCPHNGRSAQ